MSEPGFSPSHAFDREKSDFHYLTVEARDELGEGNRNTVELLLHLVDVNDNAPIFRQDSYETSIAENDDRFTSPFVVSADDKGSLTPLDSHKWNKYNQRLLVSNALTRPARTSTFSI